MNQYIDVFSTHGFFKEDDVRDKTVAVIDVLRTSSTISTALHNGAKGVIPVEDMGQAGKIAQNLDPANFLLCGEKDGQKIEGYHLGNSPLEYSREKVEGKTLILNTTNGTKAINRCEQARHVYIASFLNLDAVSRKLMNAENEIIIVCAGWKGRLSFEDMLCAGAIIRNIMGTELWDTIRDGAKVACGLFDRYGQDIEEHVSQSNHGTRLNKMNKNEDVSYCCKLNKFGVIPEFNDGIITNS